MYTYIKILTYSQKDLYVQLIKLGQPIEQQILAFQWNMWSKMTKEYVLGKEKQVNPMIGGYSLVLGKGKQVNPMIGGCSLLRCWIGSERRHDV